MSLTSGLKLDRRTMYLKKDGYTKLLIKGLYEVYIPPVPEDKTRIDGWNLPKSEQYWRRKPLPEWYEDRQKEEKIIQEQEIKLVEAGELDRVRYFDPLCEDYRREEWRRRLYGHWFMVNGTPVYITGLHYFYLQWCQIDVGYPTFYMSQVNRFYFRQLCWEDPFCHGYFIAGPRGYGKSTEEACAQLENMTKGPGKRHGAIQSKTEEDSKAFFIEKMVPMFNGLPDFFKPEYAHGSNPTAGFKFVRDSRFGSHAKKVKYNPHLELGSTVRHFPSKDKALDNKTLVDAILDEVGKLEPSDGDFIKRLGFVRKSVYRNDAKIGLIRATSTIEEMKKGGEKALKVWSQSDPNERDKNGFTISKLYKYFVSGVETKVSICDKFGCIDEKMARDTILADWKAAENDPDEYASRRRKEPLSEEDMFIKDQSETPFPVIVINDALNTINDELREINIGRPVGMKKTYLGRRGSFQYVVPGQLDGDVMWVDDENGKFTIYHMPDMLRGKRKVLNSVKFIVDDNGKKQFIPCNDDLFTGGGDPIKNKKSKDKRASKMAVYGLWRYDPTVDSVEKPLEDWLSSSIMWKYHGRSENPDDDYEAIIMALRFFGHRICPEGNIGEFSKHLVDRGYGKFIIGRGDFDFAVLASKSKNPIVKQNTVDTNGESMNALIRRTQKFFVAHGRRIKDHELMLQSRIFDIDHTGPYDLVMGFMYAVLALDHKINYDYVILTETTGEPETYFPTYNVDQSGVNSIRADRSDMDEDDEPEDDLYGSIQRAMWNS